MTAIKYPVYMPSLTGNEKKYVNQCLDSTWISSKGAFIQRFEEAFANFLGIKYAAAVSNGTVALHLAMLALDIGKGDEVIVPTLTYIASVNAINYVGATPVFVDSLLDSWQMDPKAIEKRITNKTKAILAVHLYGQTCNMSALKEISKKYGLKLIEDCAEAIGSTFNGKKAGTFADISTFSFFGNKTITSGEGGMVVTNNKKLLDKMVLLKGQGLAKNREYWHEVIGYNYRMTNICAAIGLAQLEQVEQFISKKRTIANYYKQELTDLPLTFHREMDGSYHSYWMCSILTECAVSRDALRNHLRTRGIETRPLFHPVHTMPIYLRKSEQYPIALKLSERGINLPSYPGLSILDLKYICDTINEYYKT